MTLYEKIKKNFILPTAYEDWQEYRNSLTNYLIQETNHVSVPLTFHANMDETTLLPSLAIIGAGACNDIDLQTLLSHFSTITLLDYDKEAMDTALETYHLKDCPYVECKTISLNGLSDSHYQEFCNKLQDYIQSTSGNFTPEEFENYAIMLVDDYLTSIADYSIPLTENSYDYICCFGVHSQLQAMFSYIFHVFEMNIKELYFPNADDFNVRFTTRLKKENETFIPRFHDALLNCAKQAVFLGLEQKRTSNDEAIEGAYQAIQDINNRNVLKKETTMLWSFLPQDNIEYVMSIIKIAT